MLTISQSSIVQAKFASFFGPGITAEIGEFEKSNFACVLNC